MLRIANKLKNEKKHGKNNELVCYSVWITTAEKHSIIITHISDGAKSKRCGSPSVAVPLSSHHGNQNYNSLECLNLLSTMLVGGDTTIE